ncbi:MAG TPA: crossover junction endodeoxyribonuclease RuvC [Opitutales bacterium]|nr:crossover junction endodeoxyribonuclease RuvC [Opitutales bacterium]
MNSRKLWAAKLSGKPLPKPAETPVAGSASMKLGSRFEGVVLGIDPSLRGTGLAVVEAKGGAWRLLYSKTLRHPDSMSMAECLGDIHKSVDEAIAKYSPTHVALEQTIFVQNSRTALTMGATRGAAISAAALNNRAVVEYPPARVKQSVSGSGRASKEQVAQQVKAILHLAEVLPSDESDAAAVCVCHCLTCRV